MEQGLPGRIPDRLTDQDELKTALGLLPRLVASGWFALAACIPIIFLFGLLGRILGPSAVMHSMIVPLYILAPISIAAFCGFSIGSRILNEGIVSRPLSAVIHGAGIAILSYLGFWLAATVIMALNATKNIADVLGAMLSLFGVGAILVGWLIILAGSFSGWLLFRLSRNWVGAWLSAETKKRTAVRMNSWAAVVLLAALLICWLPVRKQAQQQNSEEAKRELLGAVWQNDPERVRELMASGLPVETEEVDGSTLLLTAAERGETRIVKILLDQGANPNVTAERYGHRSPLHWAAENFDIESIRALLDRGANINATDDYGRTALMQAASTTDRETVKSLIEHGANVNYKSQDGSSALALARRDRDVAGNRDRAVDGMYGQRLDTGQNYGDSRDYQNPAIIERARARHDAIIELLLSYGAR